MQNIFNTLNSYRKSNFLDYCLKFIMLTIIMVHFFYMLEKVHHLEESLDLANCIIKVLTLKIDTLEIELSQVPTNSQD